MSEVAVLTGAGGVLCNALAMALAKEGHKIAVLDLRKEAADKVADDINKAGGTAIGRLRGLAGLRGLEYGIKQSI